MKLYLHCYFSFEDCKFVVQRSKESTGITINSVKDLIPGKPKTWIQIHKRLGSRFTTYKTWIQVYIDTLIQVYFKTRIQVYYDTLILVTMMSVTAIRISPFFWTDPRSLNQFLAL